MTNIHKKVRHHLTKYRAHIISFVSLFFVVMLLSGIFLLTRGGNPAAYELAFIERSTISAGSVIPASCESGVEHTSGECADVWWCDAQTLGSAWCTTDCCTTSSGGTKCGTNNCTCSNGATDYPTCTPPPVTCTYSYSASYPGDCDTWEDGYDYDVYSCSDGTSPGYITSIYPPECGPVCSWNVGDDCTSGANSCGMTNPGTYNCDGTCSASTPWESSCPVTPTCANGGLPADKCACDALNPANYYTDECCLGNSGERCGTQTRPAASCPANSPYTETNAGAIAGYCGACPSGYSQPSSLSCNSAAIWGPYGDSCTQPSCSGCGCIQNAAVVNGSCSGTHYGCAAGSSGSNSWNGTTYTWMCNGSGGGTNESCSETATCNDPSADNYGGVLPCTYTPYPDLTAGTVSPASAVAGTATAFSATISNQGNASTGSSFNNFIQVATAANGGGTITDLPSTSMTAKTVGANGVTSQSYTFSSAGTYSVRACADKSDRNSAGTINEGSSEGNNCSPSWTLVTVTANPSIGNVSMNYNDITFVCYDASSYTVTHNETGTVVASGPTSSGATVTAPHDQEGNYALRCIQGGLFDQAIVNYTIPVLTYDGLFITASPRTVNNNKSTTLSWSILNPKSACSLRAEVVCSGGHASCTQAQLTNETSLNTQLAGTTDANDPYGASRNIQTAVKTSAPQNNPADNKALGKKTLLMTNTTDFILDCGGALIKKFRVVTSSENEG